MKIGERIKARRIFLKMTQEELALKMGYKSRSTINKIELGINDISQSKISKFAKILKTTPAYLLDLNDNNSIGEKLKMLRVKSNLTQEDLAKSLNVKRETIHKYENDIIKNIKYETIVKLAEIFNTAPEYLLGFIKF